MHTHCVRVSKFIWIYTNMDAFICLMLQWVLQCCSVVAVLKKISTRRHQTYGCIHIFDVAAGVAVLQCCCKHMDAFICLTCNYTCQMHSVCCSALQCVAVCCSVFLFICVKCIYMCDIMHLCACTNSQSQIGWRRILRL